MYLLNAVLLFGAVSVTAQSFPTNGFFNITNFYAHHNINSAASYIAFEVAVTGSGVKTAPLTYCSFYGGNTTNNKLGASNGGDCLNTQLFWTFTGVAPPGANSTGYTLAIVNHVNSHTYDLGIHKFPNSDVKTYKSPPDAQGNVEAYAYVARPTDFSIRATKVISQTSHPPPPVAPAAPTQT